MSSNTASKERPAIERRQFDTLIIGAGGGGLRASLQLAEADLSVALTRSPHRAG